MSCASPSSTGRMIGVERAVARDGERWGIVVIGQPSGEMQGLNGRREHGSRGSAPEKEIAESFRPALGDEGKRKGCNECRDHEARISRIGGCAGTNQHQGPAIPFEKAAQEYADRHVDEVKR